MNRVLILVNIVAILIGVSYGLHGPVLPLFAKNTIGANYTDLGWIGFANFIPYMFIPFFVGILLDRFNNGYLLSIGVAINSASIFLLSTAQNVPEIMAYRIMTGIAHAFFWPPCEAIISNTSEESKRVKNISWFTMFFVTGFMIGPLIGSVILENYDTTYRFLFQITSYILASSIIASLLVSKIKIASHHDRFSFETVKEIKKFPEVIILLIFCTSSFAIILSIYPAYLNDNNISESGVLMLYFVFGASRVITLSLAGKFSGHTASTLIAAVSAISCGLLISFIFDSIISFAISLVLMGFGLSIFFPLTLEIVLSKTRKTISGKIIGVYETLFGTGWALGPSIGGEISQSIGNEFTYLVFGSTGIVVIILAILRRKKLEPKKIQL